MGTPLGASSAQLSNENRRAAAPLPLRDLILRDLILMNASIRSLALALAASASLLAACAPEPYYARGYDRGYGAGYDPRVSAPPRVEYGRVEAIEWYRDGSPRPTGLGAVLGGVAGGILGHQIGSGSGNTAATIAGAVGGALVGNEIERSNDRDRYRVIVRLENGATLAVSEVGEGQLRVGDRVRIVGNRVYRV